MKKLIRRLWNEPVFFLTGLGVAGAAVVGILTDPPTWLTVGVVAATALAGVLTRQAVSPTSEHVAKVP